GEVNARPEQRVTYRKPPETLRKTPGLRAERPYLGWKASRKFLIKGSVAGGAVYLVYDQELLGPSDKSEAALRKAGEVVPPAMYQFSQYVCDQTGLQIPKLPAPPKIYFPIRDSWNS
ncbi:MICOS complex subunit MIC13 isoform 1, partial [Daubentonia madagascariensis]